MAITLGLHSWLEQTGATNVGFVAKLCSNNQSHHLIMLQPNGTRPRDRYVHGYPPRLFIELLMTSCGLNELMQTPTSRSSTNNKYHFERTPIPQLQVWLYNTDESTRWNWDISMNNRNLLATPSSNPPQNLLILQPNEKRVKIRQMPTLQPHIIINHKPQYEIQKEMFYGGLAGVRGLWRQYDLFTGRYKHALHLATLRLEYENHGVQSKWPFIYHW